MHRPVPRLNDRDLIRAFEHVAKEFSEDGGRADYLDAFGEPIRGETVELLKELAGYEISVATLTVQNSTLRLRRSPSTSSSRIEIDNIEYLFNGRTPDYGERPQDKNIFYRVDAKLQNALAEPLALAKTAENYSTLLSHGTILERMESVAAYLIEESGLHRNRLDSEHERKEKLRQEQFDALAADERNRANEIKRQLEDEFSRKTAILEERQRELDAFEKSLDDRNNTHVRREIRTTISSIISDRLKDFTVSRATKTQYWTVNVASVAGFIMLAAASFYFGSKIQVNPQTRTYGPEAIALIIKSASFGAATIALGSWYLGWLNKWFQRIADSEFKLQQFRLDIERASWLAETVLEWKSSSQEPFPELLATRLSDGLFQSTGSNADGPRTPASHLAEALFGSASSAKIRVGENELNFDRSGIKRLDE